MRVTDLPDGLQYPHSIDVGAPWQSQQVMATIGAKARQFWQHPAGPKTIHFWAPTFKWGISIANIADFKRPAEQVSYPQQIAVTATGVIWSRFATQITPVRNS